MSDKNKCESEELTPELSKIKEQILLVRATAMTNMFDINAVQRIAYDMNLYELVVFLDDKFNIECYTNFILCGVFKPAENC